MKKLILLSILLIVGCEGILVEPEDCAGVAGGMAELDNCGICDTDKTNDCTNCKWIKYYIQTIHGLSFYKEYCIASDVGCSADPVIGDSELAISVTIPLANIKVYYAEWIHLYEDEKRVEIKTTNEGIKTIDLDGVGYTYDTP